MEEKKAFKKKLGEWILWQKNHIEDDEECKMQGNVGGDSRCRPY